MGFHYMAYTPTIFPLLTYKLNDTIVVGIIKWNTIHEEVDVVSVCIALYFQ